MSATTRAILDEVAASQVITPDAVSSLEASSDALIALIHEARRERGDARLVVGVCGTQGSGKSTAALVVKERLERVDGLRVATLSLDDLYLGREARAGLAATLHPLFRTRGVPGTHDVALGRRVLDALVGRAPGPLALPRFDKATDEPHPRGEWPVVEVPVDVVMFEGWCVGAVAEAPEALVAPVNTLEASEDPDGRWRGLVNEALLGPYRELFGRIDRLVLLQAPGFERVFAWRREQEQKLAARLAARPGGLAGTRLMDDAALARFLGHYERLTRHILREMPGRADLVLTLDDERRVRGVRRTGDGASAR